MDRKKDAILKATAALTENYKNEELFMPKNGRSLPSRAVIIPDQRLLPAGLLISQTLRIPSLYLVLQQACFRNIIQATD